MTAQRLQLTWYNKDKALIPTETGKYGYTWVVPSDPRYCETHTLVLDDYVQGSQTPRSDEFAWVHHGAPALREVEGDGLAGNEHESEPAIGERAPALQYRKEVRDVERKLRRRFGQELLDRGTERRRTSPRTVDCRLSTA